MRTFHHFEDLLHEPLFLIEDIKSGANHLRNIYVCPIDDTFSNCDFGHVKETAVNSLL